MSGIEVVGLVLGVIPLVIAAIQQYNSSLDPVRAFRRWDNLLSQAATELWHEYTLYVMALKVFLRGSVIDEILEEMASNPRCEYWQSPQIAAIVRGKLGMAYGNFESIVREMEVKFIEISRHLNFERAKSPNELEALIVANPSIPRTGLPHFEFRKRLKFTMKRQQVKSLLLDLRHYNERLNDFLQRAEKLDDGPTYKARMKVRHSVPLQHVRTSAGRLHDALIRAWKCSGYSSHSANLLLEHRLISDQNGTMIDTATFRISCLVPQPACWRDIEVRILDDSRPEAKRRVGFQVPPETPTNNVDPSQLSEVTDMYTTIQQMQSHCECIGLYLDHMGRLQGTYPCDTDSSSCDNFLTLKELLNEADLGSNKARLSYENRLRLAVIVASSFLQLCLTPWMRPESMREDLVFPISSDFTADYRRPYIATVYPGVNGGSLSDSSQGTLLLNLATVLSEISSGHKVESLRCHRSGSNADSLYLLGSLQQLVKDMETTGDLPVGIRDAISSCMTYFADPRINLQDEQFHKKFTNEVLAPLMYTWDSWHGRF